MVLALQIAAGVLIALLLWTGLIQNKDKPMVRYCCAMVGFGLIAVVVLVPAT